MTIRTYLPLFSLCLLAACGPSGASSVDELISTANQADTFRGDQGGDGDHDCDDSDDRDDGARIGHVLLVSVDGLHERDASRFIAAHPRSTLARLTAHGVEYTDAHTTTPSDSFPGMLALVTGGTPKTTGVYYDDSYDRTLYAPGTKCEGAPGTEAVYDESIEQDDSQLLSPINPDNLPHEKQADGSCTPVYPHLFLKVNTLFEVIHRAGGYTAWSDKHPAYDLLNGPSGNNIDDLFTPEVNSLIANGGVVNGVDLAGSLGRCDGTTNSLPLAKVSDYTTCIPSIEAYDDVKVQAVVNQIHGLTSDGSKAAPVPVIFGLNFQQVSVAEKLPIGGYVDGEGTPSPQLESVLEHVDASLGRFVHALKEKHLLRKTLIVVSAKHGQSPVDRAKLAMEPGGSGNATVADPLPYINAVDPNVDQALSVFVNPNSGNQLAVDGHLQTDDVGIVWLQNQSRSNIAGVVAQLTNPAHRAAMFANVLPPGTVFDANVNHGRELAEIFGDPTSADPIAAARAPNVFIQPNWGVIYSGSSKKIAEHGGGTVDDTRVVLIASNPSLRSGIVAEHVWTKQVAPTILRSLDLDPNELESVVREHTSVLPGIER